MSKGNSPAPLESSPSPDRHVSVPSVYRANADVLNRALQTIGMGRYQWQLFAVIGFGWASDNLWPIVTSLILVPVSYEFNVSQPPLLTLAQNIGLLAGALIWGFSCDIIGRRWAFNLTIAITAVFGMAAAGSPTFAAVGVFAALWSVGVGGNLPVDSAIFLEFLPGSHQYLLTILSVYWALAQLLANLIAWPLLGNMTCPSTDNCSRDNNMGWRYFLITMGGLAVVMCVVRCIFFTLYESPKFLMGKGRNHDAVMVVHEVARRNGKSSNLSAEELDPLSSTPIEAQETTVRSSRNGLTTSDHMRMLLEPVSLPHVKALFNSPRRAWSTSLMILIWTLVGLGFPLYNAFLPFLQQSRGVEFGDGSTYITYRNTLIVAAVSVPGSLVGGALVELPRLGRKGTLSLAVIATGVFLLASTTADSSAALLGWNCAFGFSSSLMYAVLYAYTPEMFETKDRGTGNALVGAANRVGGILAPIIAIAAGVQSSAPVYVSGALFLGAGLLVLLIPYETRGRASI
ncbi:MFS general substrate transporter [Aspergillus steynii IBT 23096]|uniref:MFS general substrate transporter n=1 Tax=Aspergillus steynii IBT 23096 TaxID=1392250 RepID=A0A2I2G9T7_9EURO|nr:MFS general substrate transporter [Aspergillus steynii IBT 23096]PLB49642.1 MFS general substrate transporter [Aspergillus steynii IBT 23096]